MQVLLKYSSVNVDFKFQDLSLRTIPLHGYITVQEKENKKQAEKKMCLYSETSSNFGYSVAVLIYTNLHH